MLIGYARISKNDGQEAATQIEALWEAGCERVFDEKASGARWDRPELHRLLDQLRDGDTLVVWKLDRLSRSLKDLLHILDKVEAAGASFRSLTEAVDTSGPAGRMMMKMLGAFAEFERAMVRERTRAGLNSAREQGRVGGRPPKFNDEQRAEIIDMLEAGRKPADVARLFRVHRATIARLTAAMKFEQDEDSDEARTVGVSLLSPKSSADRRPPHVK
ncbi:recombinase family protein [Rhizobium pusense]|uniref:Recombinase family protein n=3 Tax=Hyphomicrobiales TaxID=356 RepID=A0A256GZN7_9HYPH|nr:MULTISPECIES: recombinase family protein [Hyphomicrobiales]MDH0912456.1 recombinase family protein [Agrobacterium pusense]QCM13834.1 recombinase family protein [Agrobacterium tumefaciens]KAB2701542.1 recombinase family protein [Brucella lupini]MDH1098562.1 recombinase family protein [Agrobacterium pusense]MDH1115272.1 recombinase family protein [Agrobacterium pusense]